MIRRRVCWLYSRLSLRDASALMRVRQLSEIVRRGISDVNVEIVSCLKLSNIKDAFVVLNKSYLRGVSLEEIKFLKGVGNVIAVDYVDSAECYDVIDLVDVLIASSNSQLHYYRKKYPEKYSCLITHHVDPRIQKRQRSQKKCESARVGYFGDVANALWMRELDGYVDFYQVKTIGRKFV